MGVDGLRMADSIVDLLLLFVLVVEMDNTGFAFLVCGGECADVFL